MAESRNTQQIGSMIAILNISLDRKKTTFSHLIICLFGSLAVVLIGSKALGRAPWIDEMMLYSNYPLESILTALAPLGLYDQAATPAYSILFGWTAGLPTPIIRAFHLLAISFSAIAILSHKEKSIKSVLLASIVITCLWQPLYYMMEAKHYGLEAIGTLGVIAWFTTGKLDERINPASALLLIICTLLGISTLPLSGLITGILLVLLALQGKRLAIRQVLSIIAIALFLALYYTTIKNITVFQLSNYPNAYSSLGFFGNSKRFLSLVGEIVPAGKAGKLAMVGCFSILVVLGRENIPQRRLVIAIIATLLTFTGLSGIGLYPVFSSRHVIWISGLTWMMIYESTMPFISGNSPYKRSSAASLQSSVLSEVQIQAIVDRRIMQLTATAVVAFLLFQSLSNAIRVYRNVQKDDAYRAIEYIRNNPNMNIGLFGAGQAIIDYYSKQYKDIRNRVLFGSINTNSALALQEHTGKPGMIQIDRNMPGAWAQLWQKNSDYNKVLIQTLKEAPIGKEFILLTYWTGGLGHPDIFKGHGLSAEQLSIVSRNNCTILEHIDLNSAEIFKIKCR